MKESVTEWAWYVGQDGPDVEYLLHPCDVWVRNPHYKGPKGPHPEDHDSIDLPSREVHPDPYPSNVEEFERMRAESLAVGNADRVAGWVSDPPDDDIPF